MVRLVVVLIGVVLLALLTLRLLKEVGRLPVDWTGLAFAAGFIVLAFYLRHVTGIG